MEIDEKQKWIHYRLKKGEKIFLCKKCLTLSTRPRVVFDENGVCNACLWSETKKTKVDWDERWKILEKLCNKYRRKNSWDVIVPCSGGKDGSYVAWILKHKLKMHPLCVTLTPHLPTEIGKENLKNFIESGFDHIFITPNPKIYKKLAKIGFIGQGRPKLPFNVGTFTVPIKIATKFNIPFLMYGEEGETEYGGVTSMQNKFKTSRKEMVDIYFSGFEADSYAGKEGITDEDMYWWNLPSQEALDKIDICRAPWSFFENWDPGAHYKLAREKCGLQTLKGFSVGTFTNYAQLDDDIQDLHAYMMYIKFGFGRAWSDACIEIRAGRMTREQGIELVKKYDGIFPKEHLKKYLDYYDMTEEEFWKTIDSFRSKDIWEKVDGKWKLKFEIK